MPAGMSYTVIDSFILVGRGGGQRFCTEYIALDKFMTSTVPVGLSLGWFGQVVNVGI